MFTNFNICSDNCSFNINIDNTTVLFTCDFPKLYASIDEKIQNLRDGSEIVIESNDIVVFRTKFNSSTYRKTNINLVITNEKLLFTNNGVPMVSRVFITNIQLFTPTLQFVFIKFLRNIRSHFCPEPSMLLSDVIETQITKQITETTRQITVKVPKFFDVIKHLSYWCCKSIEIIKDDYDFDNGDVYENLQYKCIILKNQRAKKTNYHACVVMKEVSFNEWYDFDLPNLKYCRSDIPHDVILYGFKCLVNSIKVL